MSKAIATGAILGSHYYVKQAEALVEKAISEKGADFKFEFPDTAYFLPQMFTMTGFEVRTLGDMKTALDWVNKSLEINSKPFTVWRLKSAERRARLRVPTLP